jgi:type I restriction enzyme S subunit
MLNAVIKFKETEIGTIPEEWVFLPLAEAVDFNPRRELKKGKQAKFVAMADVEIFTKKISTFSIKDFSGGTKFKNGDTLMARITPCLENGKTGFVDFLEKEEVAGGSTEFIVLSGKEKVSDSGFVYYLSISPTIRQAAIKAMTGTSGRQRVENSKFTNQPVQLPSMVEQKQIAEILSSLDDKIDLNRKINANLEKLASSLFKRWFVDFEFPDKNGQPYKSSGGKMMDSELGEIPNDWCIEKIGNLKLLITDYVANGSFASLKENVSKIFEEEEYALFIRNTDLKNNFASKRYVDRKAYDFLLKTHLKGGEVVISNVADVGSVYKCPKFKKPMVLGNNVIMLDGNFLNNYLYLLFISQQGQSLIESITSGSAQLKFNKTDFRNLDIINPGNDILKMFDIICEQFFSTIQNNRDEIDNLVILRDSLLPRLMSGKIRVNNN